MPGSMSKSSTQRPARKRRKKPKPTRKRAPVVSGVIPAVTTTRRRLVFAPSASDQIRQADAAWRERYPDYPRAFAWELKRQLQMLQEGWGGGKASGRHRDDVYRLVLKRVRALLFYRPYEKRIEIIGLMQLPEPPAQ